MLWTDRETFNAKREYSVKANVYLNDVFFSRPKVGQRTDMSSRGCDQDSRNNAQWIWDHFVYSLSELNMVSSMFAVV